MSGELGFEKQRADVVLAGLDSFRGVFVTNAANVFTGHKRAAMSVEERTKFRQSAVALVFDALVAWAELDNTRIQARSSIADAINYRRTYAQGLRPFVDDGRVRWTNNESERLLRSIVVDRNAWLYRGTFESAQNACVLWRLMQSCRSLHVNPANYLADVIEAMAVVSASELHACFHRGSHVRFTQPREAQWLLEPNTLTMRRGWIEVEAPRLHANVSRGAHSHERTPNANGDIDRVLQSDRRGRSHGELVLLHERCVFDARRDPGCVRGRYTAHALRDR